MKFRELVNELDKIISDASFDIASQDRIAYYINKLNALKYELENTEFDSADVANTLNEKQSFSNSSLDKLRAFSKCKFKLIFSPTEIPNLEDMGGVRFNVNLYLDKDITNIAYLTRFS